MFAPFDLPSDTASSSYMQFSEKDTSFHSRRVGMEHGLFILENGCDHHPIEPCTYLNLQPPRCIQISWRRCGVYQDEKQTARPLVCMCFASLFNHPVAT
jgi:hypothetical protein